ncbi:DUF4312 family protein [Lactococcus raffinolactis]|nr:DUF4312 family protein [Lactococcus raffinolactis]
MERKQLDTMTTSRKESVEVSGQGMTKQSAFSDAIAKVQKNLWREVKMFTYRLNLLVLKHFRQLKRLTQKNFVSSF